MSDAKIRKMADNVCGNITCEFRNGWPWFAVSIREAIIRSEILRWFENQDEEHFARWSATDVMNRVDEVYPVVVQRLELKKNGGLFLNY